MGLIESLEAAKVSLGAVYNRFLISYKAGDPKLYLFVEGKHDMPFYSAIMRSMNMSRGEYSLVKCEGKRTVLELHEQIVGSGSYPDARVGFIVDRDYDSYCGMSSNVPAPRKFVTDGYSIESYLCSSDVAVAFVMDSMRLPVGLGSEGSIESDFNEFWKSFEAQVSSLMTILIAIRIVNIKANFNDIDVRDYYRLDDARHVFSKMSKAAMIEALRKTIKIPNPPSDEWRRAMRKALQIVKKDDSKNWIRGKQAIAMLLVWIRHITEEIQCHRNKVGATCMSYQIGEKSAVELLVAKMIVPTDLSEFICRIR